MASDWTRRGIEKMFEMFFRASAAQTSSMSVALCTGATTPAATHVTLGQLTQINAGNGYTAGGASMVRNATDFDTITTGSDMLIQLKDVVWTASGGSIPASGSAARWAVLTDHADSAGNTNEIYAYWDLASDRTVSDTQTLTLQNCELKISDIN